MTSKRPSHLKDLTSDPRNARKHNPRNVGMIEDALRRVGAARSIVIDEDGVVLAGNATIEAAAAAGIEKVTVVDVDGETIVAVRRSNLNAKQKRQLGALDNRSAELADWDIEQLQSYIDEGDDLGYLFTDDELAGLMAYDPDSAPEDGEGEPLPTEEWGVIVECRNEQEQTKLLDRLTDEGLTCRALIV